MIINDLYEETIETFSSKYKLKLNKYVTLHSDIKITTFKSPFKERIFRLLNFRFESNLNNKELACIKYYIRENYIPKSVKQYL